MTCCCENEKVVLKFWKEREDAQIPKVAYGNSSACWDLIAVEDTVIPARGSAVVENGLRVMIPEGWYLKISDRSGNGFKKGLHCHHGILDSFYSGPIGVKLYNMTDQDQIIEKGNGICQVETFKKPDIEICEATQEEWDEYSHNTIRGENGFGSSDKK